MLHGGRLGNVRDSVAHFTSSRKDDARLIEAVLAINKAHIAMVMEQKIIQWQLGAKILTAIASLSASTLDPAAEDVHMAVEEAILAQTGPEIGGNMHIAKSRNDQVTTAIRMTLRNELLSIMQKILDMQQSLLDTAAKHLDTIILEYTHLQAAQPVTYAHYLVSQYDALERDLQRLQSAYKRVNLSPLGAGALATTSFPLNRKRTSVLLGFDDVLENSIDAVGSRDFIIETIAALSLTAVNLSRFAEDLIIWSSAEFGTVELPDEFTSTSSIMPQKKNPECLEVIRARASYVLGDYVAVVAAIKSLPTTYNLDFQEMTPKLWAVTDNLNVSLVIFAQLVPNIKVFSDIKTKAAMGFVGATELANVLVRKYGVAFRTAHKVVGALVKVLIDSKQTLLNVTPQLLQKTAKDSASLELIVELEDIVGCTNPRKIVEAYKVQGGPSPVEVERVLKEKFKSRLEAEKAVLSLKTALSDASSILDALVGSYSSQ
ncbi:MAG: argininosuccinate lyase [Nitrososphaerota archaeon]|jgi:argininosuccinate lyase|nr:argininosuccinate lyase [Nitrososphaerota archaeon]